MRLWKLDIKPVVLVPAVGWSKTMVQVEICGADVVLLHADQDGARAKFAEDAGDHCFQHLGAQALAAPCLVDHKAHEDDTEGNTVITAHLSVEEAETILHFSIQAVYAVQADEAALRLLKEKKVITNK